MSSYAQEVARRRQAAIRREPVTGQQMGLGGLLHGLARTGALATTGGEGLGYFDAVTNRLGGGAALNPYQYPPMPGGAIRLGGRYAPRTPGLTAETLQHGDKMMNFEGQLENAAVGGGSSAYNLRNEAGDIVASADRNVYPAGRSQSGSAYVPSMWVDPAYRKTPAMFDLYNLLSRGGKTPLHASFANDRLKKVFEKRMGRKHADAVRTQLGTGTIASRREATLAAERNETFRRNQEDFDALPDLVIDDLPLGPRGRRPTPSAATVRQGLSEPTQFGRGGDVTPAMMQNRRQLTNKDVPSVRQMAPARVPLPPRPAPSPIAGKIALEARAREQERALLDARRAEYLKDIEKMIAQSRREAVIRRGGR